MANQVQAYRWDEFGPAGAHLHEQICGAYQLSPGEAAILAEACRTADLIFLMERELWSGTSVMVRGASGQPRVSPLIAQIGEQRRVLASLITALALPMPDEEEGEIRSPIQAAKANARWARRDKGKPHGALG